MNKNAIFLAIGIAAVLAVGLAGITTTPIHAVKPQYCSQGGAAEECNPSANQCQRNSPGQSGCKSNEAP